MIMILDNWAGRSNKGEVCAVLGCSLPPTFKCPICYNNYCLEDSKNHSH